MADVHSATDDIRNTVQNWMDANDLDQTLEDLHHIPRSVQVMFREFAEKLREDTNLDPRIAEAVDEAGAQMQGIADGLQEEIGFGVQRS